MIVNLTLILCNLIDWEAWLGQRLTIFLMQLDFVALMVDFSALNSERLAPASLSGMILLYGRTVKSYDVIIISMMYFMMNL